MTNSVALSRRGLLRAGGAALLATPFLGKGARAATTLRYGHMHTPASIAGAQAEWFAAAVKDMDTNVEGGVWNIVPPEAWKEAGARVHAACVERGLSK